MFVRCIAQAASLTVAERYSFAVVKSLPLLQSDCTDVGTPLTNSGYFYHDNHNSSIMTIAFKRSMTNVYVYLD